MTNRIARPSARVSCVLLASLAAAAAACGDGKELQPAGDLGALGLAIEVAPGVTVTRLNYRVLKDGVVVITGTADTEDQALVTLAGLPAGTGYVVELSATTSQGVPCTGSASFTVSASASTVVSVPMSCGVASRGDARVVPDFRGCTRIAVISASAVAGAGRDFALSVAAAPGASGLTYAWASTGGSFDSPTSGQTVFHCGPTTAGLTRVTATVTDATCTDSVSTDVDCGTPPPPPVCGDGVVGPGEACDAADLPTATCDETCTAQPNACTACYDMNCPADLAGCGPLAGDERRQCQTVAACAFAAGCVGPDGDGSPCYCGTADIGGCLSGSANGPCKAAIEVAAQTTDPTLIAERFVNPEFPLGRALNLFGCKAAFCAAECPLSRASAP